MKYFPLLTQPDSGALTTVRDARDPRCRALARRTASPSLSILLLVLLSGCSDAPQKVLAAASDAAVEFGLRERVIVPVVVDVVLDPSLESPGQMGTWESTFTVVLPVVLSSNGLLRSWVVTPEGAVLIASFAATPNTRPGTPARDAHAKAERERAIQAFKPVEVFLQRPAGVRSPLFNGLTTVGAETTPGKAQRILVVISDGKEYDLVDWECQRITPLPTLTALLDREHFLLPGSLRGVGVHWTFFRTTPTSRCRGHEHVRQDDLTTRWREILQRAGARPTFSTGPISLDVLKGAK